MADFDLTQTGQEVQNILDGAAMQTDLTAEVDRAELAEQTLQGNIDIEATRAKAAEKQNADDIDVIEGKIPAAASDENQLADKNFVNSSIATATATYRGAYNLVSDLSLTVDATHEQIATALAGEISTADNNDYCFVQIPTSSETPTQIASIERYKFNGSAWAYEYTLNNSGFTADQWAALNSGITSGLVTKLTALPTNDELALALAGKQNVLTFDNEPTENSNNPVKSSGVYSAIGNEETRAKAAEKANADDIDTIEEKIPAAASSENQLADKSFVNSSIATATATFKGTYNLVNDLSLTIDATHEQIAAALANEISTADNNDYCFVQIPTSIETSTQIASIERYKFNGSAWAYEYTLNNSGFTADQWAALNSGITSGLVAKLTALPTNSEIVLALAGKQDVLTFDNEPTENSNNPVKSGGVYDAIDVEATTRAAAIAAIVALIPEAASALNKLADKSFVNSSISTATAVFKGTFNVVVDMELSYNATQEQIALMLASKIIAADNNDYCFVQIPTSDETPLQIARTDRYKFNGSVWAYEYTLNNSGFTSVQWAAINSGITSLLKDKLIDLPTAAELTALLASKQNQLTFDTTPTTDSTNPVTSGGVKTAIDTEKARAEAAEADRYTKAETYSKNEIDGLVSTPHQEYVTVATYASLPASGSTDTIYRVSSYDGANSQVDDTVYSEYAWDGTQYVFLCVKSQIEEVFDITVHNNNTKYADLAAALGVDGANIPATLRRGGMSIKFVQSSDNKYVQCFLTKDEWSIDPNDWEKMNLEEEVSQLGQDLRFLSNDFQCFRMFGSSKADGVMQGTLMYSDFFRSILSLQLIGFEKGEAYYVQTIQRTKGTKYRLIFYKYDSDTQTWSNYADFRYDGNIEGSNYDEIGVFDKTLANGKRCIAVVDFSFYKNNNLACTTTTSFIVKDECLFPNGLPIHAKDKMELQSQLNGCVNDTDISIDIISNNIANPSNIQDGMIVNSEGGISPLSGWSMISVPVSEGDVLTVGGFTLGRFAYYAYYNGSSLVSFGQIQDPQGTSNPTTFTVPSGVDTLYIDIKTDESGSNYDNLMINYGGTLKEYDEFKQAITAINNVPLAGQAIGESLNNLVVDLPVSDGTDIQSGYAYIDSTDRCVKVKE